MPFMGGLGRCCLQAGARCICPQQSGGVLRLRRVRGAYVRKSGLEPCFQEPKQ